MEHRSKRLDKLIPAYVARHPNCSAVEIRAGIKSIRACSLQAIHKMLRSLEADGCVAKLGTRYFIHLSWILDLQSAAEKMLQAASSPQALRQLIPAAGEKRTLHFSSLQQSGVIGTQLLLQLLLHSNARAYFEYTPHCYYHLASAQSETRYLAGLGRAQVAYYLAVGYDSVLDRSFTQHLQAHALGGGIRFGASDLFKPWELYYAVIGDFLVRARLESRLIAEIHRLFSTTTILSSATLQNAVSIVTQRASVRVSIERATPAQRRATMTFRQFFGVKS